MSLIKLVPYVLGVTKMPLGAPEPRMYPCSGYFLVSNNSKNVQKCPKCLKCTSESKESKEAKQYNHVVLVLDIDIVIDIDMKIAFFLSIKSTSRGLAKVI